MSNESGLSDAPVEEPKSPYSSTRVIVQDILYGSPEVREAALQRMRMVGGLPQIQDVASEEKSDDS